MFVHMETHHTSFIKDSQWKWAHSPRKGNSMHSPLSVPGASGGPSAGWVLPHRVLTACFACFLSADKCKVPRERTKEGDLSVLKNPIICLLRTDIHMWKDDLICQEVNVKCHLSWMDYISDMSSEARPRSLPAVMVKAGLTGGDAHVSLAWGVDCLWAGREKGWLQTWGSHAYLKDGWRNAWFLSTVLKVFLFCFVFIDPPPFLSRWIRSAM